MASMAAAAAMIPGAGAAARVTPSAAIPQRDPLERLKELTQLRDAGALTPAEFEAQKAKILAQS